MNDKQIAKLIKSVKIKDMILLKSSVGLQVAHKIRKAIDKPIILLDDFNDFSSISKQQLKRLLKDD